MPTTTPMVPYKPPNSDYAQFIDLQARFYQERIVFINRFLDEEAANGIISLLLYLRNEDPRGMINLYLNIPGGHMRPCLAIYDLICQTRRQCKIRTANLGLCAGMGAFLCSAGTKGSRGGMPNARFLIQRTGLENPFQGQASDIGLEVSNLKTWNDRMEEELAEMTGRPISIVRNDLKRDFYLTSAEAVKYGLIDQVLMPDFRKRRAVGAEFGKFEGETQRYQGQGNQGGWGGRPPPMEKKDDDEPLSAKD
eukprot:CAMPEP_0116551912 /NCGR_PEP_ID=MMETSP0397-20121206/6206_1 /TAXON_ID=216820 /ORGANISM="Cyclophora tenuis, Strain ECT3854" /LENGTH=250 /DNA_ID=CAMNT_0004076827 /DNA_START=180 /DNA_END=932 /DNA_ORIENTATION=+